MTADVEIVPDSEGPKDQKDLETAMAALEDEQDVAASKMAAAEAKADRAEFDEAKKETTTSLIGTDEADDKYLELINQVGSISFKIIHFSAKNLF